MLYLYIYDIEYFIFAKFTGLGFLHYIDLIIIPCIGCEIIAQCN